MTRLIPYERAAVVFNLAVMVLALLLGVSDAAVAAPPVRLLMLGDSLTAGYGLPEADSLPVQLQAALRRDGRTVEVINGGVSGDTTAGGLARLDWMLGDKPDYVIVELGANDALRGIDPKEAYDNLDRILTRLDRRGIKVLLAGMRAPRNLGPDYDDAFDAIYPRLAARHKCLLYPFLLDGVALDPTLNQPDGLHPNAAGVRIIVQHLTPYVERLLGG